jgi:filamentous hemagglutinin family protein
VGTTTYHITDSLGKRAGQNLFHSFSSFNVSSGECATFTSASNGIRNVVSRVTGGHSSTIDGTLRSTIQGASLYFLNPCGVVFGPNASLDVKGSFHVSTADYLRFEDGISFHSTPSASDQVLSTASPVAFGFLSASPGPVYASQSFLEVPAGETLSIVGGEIGLHGAYLSAPGGRIHLASMAFPGEVIPSPAGSPPGIQVLPEKASGSIGIDGASILSVDGAPSGTILIRGGRLVLDNEAFISANNEGDLPASWSVIGIAADNVTLDNGSWMLAAAFGAGKGATIEIDAKNIVLSHESLIGALPWWESTGDGGDIKIATSLLEIAGASFISTDNRGFGRGGLLRAEATGSIRLADTYSGLSSAAWSDGEGGKIVLKTPHLLLENEAMVYGDSFGDGRGGEISIAAGKLSLLSGASISSNSFGPAGNGGDLSVSATESISISGIGPTGLKSSLENRTTGAGNAGRIRVITPLLDIGEHGSISAETLGAGRAGDIDRRLCVRQKEGIAHMQHRWRSVARARHQDAHVSGLQARSPNIGGRGLRQDLCRNHVGRNQSDDRHCAKVYQA